FQGQRIMDCPDAADVNDDGIVNISDPVYLLRFLFQGGPGPPPPFPVCGADPTADSLGCASYTTCVLSSVLDDLLATADGIFFVVDRSPQIGQNKELGLIKKAIIDLLARAAADVQFGIIFFDAGLRLFPESKKPALAGDPAMKASATSFIEGVGGGAGTCGQK